MYDQDLESDAKVRLLNVLSVAALKDDVILLLHQDRREHVIMNYAYDIDRLPKEEQLPLAQFVSTSYPFKSINYNNIMEINNFIVLLIADGKYV